MTWLNRMGWTGPSRFSATGSTLVLEGTIANDADVTSPYAVTLTASDGTDSAQLSFTWTIAVPSTT